MNKQYMMSTTDVVKFKEIKESSLYKDYINTIVSSPILINIANEHIKNIDITDDIDGIIGKNGSNSKKLNTLFKDTLKNMTINIIADTLILKDIVDVSFEDSLIDIEDNFKIKYLLGLADEEFYEKAKLIIEEHPDTASLTYIGYMEYQKRIEKNTLNEFKIEDFIPKNKSKLNKKPTPVKSISNKKIDICSNDIEF